MPKKRKSLDKAFENLNEVYKHMPETKGCMDHISKPVAEGGCGSWCCQVQQPQVLYTEFRNAWSHIVEKWDAKDILDLVEAAMRSYLSNVPTKGCIFWHREEHICKQHNTRPYSCRVYGITPDAEFKPRFERLKVLYQDHVGAIFRDQCNLVKTCNGKKVTTEDTHKWWSSLEKVEQSIGIDKKDITEAPGGSYRTYPEHILNHMLSKKVIDALQTLRVHGSESDKCMAIVGLMEGARTNLKKINQA